MVEDRRQMDSYTLLNLSAGVNKDNWTLTLYANNVTDERGQLDFAFEYRIPPSGLSGVDQTQTIIRPRSFGIRWSQRF